MKSNLFLKTDILRKDKFEFEPFGKDLEVVLGLTDDVINKVIYALPEYIFEKYKSNAKNIKEKIVSETGINYCSFDSIQSISLYFIKKFIKEGDASKDKLEDIADDLVTLGAIKVENIKTLIFYLNKVREITNNVTNQFVKIRCY